MAAGDIAPWIAAAGGVTAAALAGFWQQRQAKATAAPDAQDVLNEGFGQVVLLLRHEVARLTSDVASLHHELWECTLKHDRANRDLAALKAEVQRLKGASP